MFSTFTVFSFLLQSSLLTVHTHTQSDKKEKKTRNNTEFEKNNNEDKIQIEHEIIIFVKSLVFFVYYLGQSFERGKNRKIEGFLTGRVKSAQGREDPASLIF